jgi:pimeloyl-ACP methyl ester carboxylesterase
MQTMTLRDGRTVAFDDIGDPDGFPVIYNHGFLNSRLARGPDDSAASRAGLRVICLDRPGYGGSSPQAYYTLWGWAADVQQVADHLGIGRFAVLGWSGGCAYSLAIARYLDDRVTHGVLVSSPVDDPQVYRMVHWFFLVPGLLSGIPPLQKALPTRMSRQAHADIDALVASFQTPRASNPLSEPDRALLREPTMRDQWKANWTEAFRQGPAGVIPDYMAPDRTEGFLVQDVRQHMDLFHGDRDIAIKPIASQILAEQLPDADLHIISGAGHLCLLSHWEQILTAVADRAPTHTATSLSDVTSSGTSRAPVAR